MRPFKGYGAVPFQPAPSNPSLTTQPKLDQPSYLEEGEFMGIDKNHFKRTVTLLHSMILLVLLIPLLMLCTSIANNEDVSYFVGGFVAKLSWLFIPLLMLIPALHAVLKRLPTSLFMATLWVPAVCFVFITYYYKDRLMTVQGALAHTDCTTFVEKRALNLAYVEALNFYNSCEDAQPEKISSIRDCPHYFDLSLDYVTQFDYLQDLERRFPCSGICSSGRTLWEDAGRSVPSCGIFVSQWIHQAESQANMAFWYTILLLLVIMPVLALILEGFVKDYLFPMTKQLTAD